MGKIIKSVVLAEPLDDKSVIVCVELPKENLKDFFEIFSMLVVQDNVQEKLNSYVIGLNMVKHYKQNIEPLERIRQFEEKIKKG